MNLRDVRNVDGTDFKNEARENRERPALTVVVRRSIIKVASGLRAGDGGEPQVNPSARAIDEIICQEAWTVDGPASGARSE